VRRECSIVRDQFFVPASRGSAHRMKNAAQMRWRGTEFGLCALCRRHFTTSRFEFRNRNSTGARRERVPGQLPFCIRM
jgi:hypothetical protein